MATISHTIYSHYDPNDRERLERETGQLDEKDDAEDSWKTEPPKYRNQAPVPRFVPATVAHGTWSPAQPSSSRHKLEEPRDGGNSDVAYWYRSLRNSLTTSEEASVKRPSSPAAPPQQPSTQVIAKVTTKMDKNNWFITNAIESEPLGSCTTPELPPPTLADILARDPPPRPNERKFKPPVFLEIGPNNKGFAMLQKRGWNEGEALGPDIVRRKPQLGNGLFGDRYVKNKAKAQTSQAHEKGKGRRPMATNAVESVIDLTRSDSEPGESDSGELICIDESVNADTDVCDASIPYLKLESILSAASSPHVPGTVPSLAGPPGDREEDSASGRKALLTPLATVLKSDRLGIGLKAKTVGPYKASRKRVTHNASALATHIRGAEELKKKKGEFGRGRRGFERQYRKDSMKRQMTLAYLNS